MSSALIIAARCLLIAILLGSSATCMWGNSRMMRRAREAGHPYWMINPMSAFVGLRGKELPINILAGLTGLLSVMGLIALK